MYGLLEDVSPASHAMLAPARDSPPPKTRQSSKKALDYRRLRLPMQDRAESGI
ncbi:Uncharacterised protein [Bordetella pertussis]|nr:Uncharacterised protein [Bordetella pertussis]